MSNHACKVVNAVKESEVNGRVSLPKKIRDLDTLVVRKNNPCL